jgi:hypothetical protein
MSQKICRYFLSSGGCKFGDGCHYLHPVDTDGTYYDDDIDDGRHFDLPRRSQQPARTFLIAFLY